MPAEAFFKITTARGYWLDSVIQTERKAAQAGAPVWSYRLMWRSPVEDGRRITPHSLDLPFIFDNVQGAGRIMGPGTAQTAAMTIAMSEPGSPSHGPATRITRPSPPARLTTESRPVMLFDSTCAVQADPHQAERISPCRPTRPSSWGAQAAPPAPRRHAEDPARRRTGLRDKASGARHLSSAADPPRFMNSNEIDSLTTQGVDRDSVTLPGVQRRDNPCTLRTRRQRGVRTTSGGARWPSSRRPQRELC